MLKQIKQKSTKNQCQNVVNKNASTKRNKCAKNDEDMMPKLSNEKNDVKIDAAVEENKKHFGVRTQIEILIAKTDENNLFYKHLLKVRFFVSEENDIPKRWQQLQKHRAFWRQNASENLSKKRSRKETQKNIETLSRNGVRIDPKTMQQKLSKTHQKKEVQTHTTNVPNCLPKRSQNGAQMEAKPYPKATRAA